MYIHKLVIANILKRLPASVLYLMKCTQIYSYEFGTFHFGHIQKFKGICFVMKVHILLSS